MDVHHVFDVFRVPEGKIIRLINNFDRCYQLLQADQTIIFSCYWVVKSLQENFRVKGKKLYFGFVDLEKAFDRVPREMTSWAMRKLGVEEWLVSAVMSMYIGVKTVVRTVYG